MKVRASSAVFSILLSFNIFSACKAFTFGTRRSFTSISRVSKNLIGNTLSHQSHRHGVVSMSNLVELLYATRVHKFSWQRVILRIKDPKVYIPYYEMMFGFKLIWDLLRVDQLEVQHIGAGD